MSSQPPLWRKLATYGAKLGVAGGLLYWLAASGRLKLNDLTLFLSHPLALGINAAVWLVGPILLGGLRWHLLLRTLGLTISAFQALRLQLIAAFFNLALPSSLGGDGARFFYAPRRGIPAERGRLLLSLVMDRFCGMCGLFFAAALAMFVPGRPLQTPALVTLSYFVYCGSAVILLGLVAGWAAPLPWLQRLRAEASRRLPALARGDSVFEALAAYKSRPSAVVGAMAISVSAHAVTLFYLRYLTEMITGQDVAFATLASVVPAATLITAVPLAPGGLGVGHLAFEQLFQVAGLSGGANVYNLSALGQMAMNLLGAGAFLSSRRLKAPPATPEDPSGNQELATPAGPA